MSEKITAVQRRLLEEVADLHGVPEGAYNIRANGHLASRQTTANISIESKTDVSGIDIRIKPGTVNESVHIPVVLSESGLKEMVYNDFYIGEGSDVLIVAGCGIDNCGSQDSQHDGLHRFFVEKNAHVRYVEKHYGSGDGTGKRLLNPGTEVHLAQGSSMEMEMVQIRGVDSAYSVAALLNKKLIEEAGRLNVPGRPIQYKTTPDFLRTFGLSSLEELPPIEKITFGEPVELPEQPPAGEEA